MESRGGSHEQHVKAGQAGGQATKEEHGPEFYREIGRKGGEASHGGTKAERDETEEMDEEGEEGRSRGGTREQHAEAGRQSHKNS